MQTNTKPGILVVDDEFSIRSVMDRLLSKLGYTVYLAENGKEALTMLDSKAGIVAMLSDIKMPEMLGTELVPKALERVPDLAIVMLTAVTDPETAAECMRRGARDYLLKPVDIDVLRASLDRALKGGTGGSPPAITAPRTLAADEREGSSSVT